MDYAKSGNPKGARHNPRGPDHSQKGAPKSVTPPRETKDELLARMKAAAKASVQTKPEQTKPEQPKPAQPKSAKKDPKA